MTDDTQEPSAASDKGSYSIPLEAIHNLDYSNINQGIAEFLYVHSDAPIILDEESGIHTFSTDHIWHKEYVCNGTMLITWKCIDPMSPAEMQLNEPINITWNYDRTAGKMVRLGDQPEKPEHQGPENFISSMEAIRDLSVKMKERWAQKISIPDHILRSIVSSGVSVEEAARGLKEFGKSVRDDHIDAERLTHRDIATPTINKMESPTTQETKLPSGEDLVPIDIEDLFGPALKWALIRSVLVQGGEQDKFPDVNKILNDPEISATLVVTLIKEHKMRVASMVDSDWRAACKGFPEGMETIYGDSLEESVARAVVYKVLLKHQERYAYIPSELYPED